MRRTLSQLSAPFVMTASLGAGVGVALAEPLPEAPAGARVSRRPDGRCFVSRSIKCTPGRTCNPPPPMPVRCPPPEPQPEVRIERLPDGTCLGFVRMHCPDGAKCNPPPPRPVPCPPIDVTPPVLPEPIPVPDPFPQTPPTEPDPFPAAPPGWQTWRNETTDECYASEPDAHCEPGDACNPPPPMRVRCPGR